jgi:hypothetical protein
MRRVHALTHWSRTAWSLALLISAALLPKPASAVEVLQALALIEANEKRYQSEQWAIEFRQGTLADPYDLKSISFGTVFHRGRTIVEPISGRYRADLESVMPWAGGTADYIAQRGSWSYNGQECRDFTVQKPGKELPNNPPKPGEHRGDGKISRLEDARNEFPAYRGATGIAEMPPKFRGEKLSTLIREGLKHGSNRPVSITETAGIWQISTPELDGDSTIVIDYDPNKRVILQAVWKNGTPQRAWSQYTVRLQQAGKDFWIPKDIYYVNLIDKMVDWFGYTGVRINEKVDEIALTLEFPPHAQVVDYIRNPPE